MKLFKQIRIDKGQLGGFLQIITLSTGLFTILNSIGIASLFYDRFLKSYFSITTGAIIITGGAFCYWIVYYSIIYPSIIQFSQRQAYAHNSPVKKDFEKLNNKIDRINQQLEGLK